MSFLDARLDQHMESMGIQILMEDGLGRRMEQSTFLVMFYYLLFNQKLDLGIYN